MKILVIGAHADDPEVSMGGTIKKFIDSGHEVKLLICIIPEESRSGEVIRGAKKERFDYQKDAAKSIGCGYEILDLNPYSFQFNREIVKTIDRQVLDFMPDVIFTHWEYDTHQDHRVVANATFAAARKNNISVLMYEQLTLGGISPHSFCSHVYVDITNQIESKINSVKCYKFLKESDIEAIISLARFRGNQIGVKYAECFQVCKLISEISDEGFKISSIYNEKFF